jgi:dihydroorotate dehydrogenase electron transfer subunit
LARQWTLTVTDQRDATAGLRWLTLAAPEIARDVRPGQYLLLRCDDPGDTLRMLPRALFVAGVEPALGQIGLLFAPDESGRAWLARRRAGDMVEASGPYGRPFQVDQRTRSLLLLGEGSGLAALLLLAREAAGRGAAVTLFAGATASDALPPPFLLPPDVEYETTIGPAVSLLANHLGGEHPVRWADRICAALPKAQIGVLRDAVRSVRFRWDRGFASVLLEGPLVCGVGACGGCAVTLRRGQQQLCSEGPVFDLKELGREAS